MTDKRLFLALVPLALLAACNDEVSDESASASGEVLEGTISDAMLPLDRVRSEPPLEDPEAFAEAQSEARESPAGRAAEEPAPGSDDAAPTDDAESDDTGAEPAAQDEE